MWDKKLSDALVDIRHLSKVFAGEKVPALKEFNASIPYGEIVGLVGPDGAGKTTLIRLIAALLLPTKGYIRVAGKDTVKDPEFIHASSGYMPQRFGLYEDLTVMQNLNLYADLRDVTGEERESTFEKLLTFTQLAPFQDRLAKALSGGMKQKLGLACALIKKPTLLLLDEPSVGVDPVSRRELWKMVYALLDEGISVIWSTAYLDEAEHCHTVLLLNKGELLYAGKPKELTKRAEGRVFLLKGVERSLHTALTQVLEQENVIDGVIQGRDIRIVLGEKTETPPAGCVSIAARFEDAFIDILGGGPGGHSLLAERRATIPDRGKIIVYAEKLTKKFNSFTAVDGVNIIVKRGEVFGLLGPNGAGKSTTFKMLCGLLRPTGGRALIDGYDLQEAPVKQDLRSDIWHKNFLFMDTSAFFKTSTFFQVFIT